ncbi:MAG: 50S ribosomal protein L19 [Clostridiales bacterium]|jgi:large subunit ribosomal protein L19|nr:50S ribosomal protein L19 [Clostridiales bacterium]
MQKILDDVVSSQIRSDLFGFNTGDTVKVYSKIIDGTKERTQAFEGVIIKIQNGGINKNITVRRIALGTGVEKTWNLNSPRLLKIEIIKKGIVRRAKLYYLRNRTGKAAKIKELINKKR